MALVVKKPPASAGDVRTMGLIPEFGRSSGEGNGCPLQYSCLGNSMDLKRSLEDCHPWSCKELHVTEAT